MKFLRLFYGMLCLFYLSIATADNFGIAFIHGTNDHRKDAATEYWKKDFINPIVKSLPDPQNYWILACDFTHYMWHEATAGCTANQLLAFIDNKKLTKLTVYTHSNGANVIRFILSNPTYDPRFMKLSKIINQVIAIDPSSGGTPLADESVSGGFGESMSWLLGYDNDAIRQQRVGDMAIYNAEILLGSDGRPALPVPFRYIVGSAVISPSFCNGFFLNAGLSLTKSYLEPCSDGFLNCKSQAAAGTLWFIDTQKTVKAAPLNHNQSRHSCFGLEKIIIRDLAGATA